MKILSEMCLGTRTYPLNFRARKDLYEMFTRGVSRGEEQSINFGGGLLSLSDCLVCYEITSKLSRYVRI